MILLPGFTQTASSWRAVVDHLDARHDARAVEIPQGLDFAATAGALAGQHGTAIWVGYSMGGRLALRLALDHPEAVEKLVLVSATAGIDDVDERRRRVDADERRAAGIERDGVARFLERWLEQPLFRTVPRDAAGLADRQRVPAPVLTHQLRALGTGAMQPMWDELTGLDVPVLLVTGQLDEKFDRLNARMAELIGDARHVRLPGGHAVPLESPDALATTIEEFTRA